jgi:hypothetical protein
LLKIFWLISFLLQILTLGHEVIENSIIPVTPHGKSFRLHECAGKLSPGRSVLSYAAGLRGSPAVPPLPRRPRLPARRPARLWP